MRNRCHNDAAAKQGELGRRWPAPGWYAATTAHHGLLGPTVAYEAQPGGARWSLWLGRTGSAVGEQRGRVGDLLQAVARLGR